MLRSHFCDYNEAYLVVKKIISGTGTNKNNGRKKS